VAIGSIPDIGGSRWRLALALGLAAAVGAAGAIAVDRLLLDDDDPSVGAGDVTLTPDDVGANWSLDATVALGGDDDVGLLDGCALTGGTAGDDPGSFNALSDGSGDAITNEVRVAASASNAAEVFDAATSIEATECFRAALESRAVSQFAPAAPITAAIEPLETTPWADQAAAYRVRVDVAGAPVQWVDVHILRNGPAVAVVQLLDQGERMSAELPVHAVRAVLDGMVANFGRP
jgi:hypothetical protein